MLIPNIKNGKLERYDFKHICPRLLKEQDFGIDLTGMLSYNNKYYPVALQVKFWNPMTDNPITNEIAQKAHSDAICNNFINQNDNKNIVICWLGNTKKVSKYLTLNDKLYEQDVRDCRIQLNLFLNKVDSNGLESIDDQELELYSHLYDHYTEDLGKNSFIHDKWKRVMTETKK